MNTSPSPTAPSGGSLSSGLEMVPSDEILGDANIQPKTVSTMDPSTDVGVAEAVENLVDDFMEQAHIDPVAGQVGDEAPADAEAIAEVEALEATPSVGGGITNATRPENLEDLVGMETAKRKLNLAIRGSIMRNQPLRSFLITGPSGTGKTTLAKIIHKLASAKFAGNNLICSQGSDITSTDDLYSLATTAKDGDVIFIEEAHTLGGGGKKSKTIQAALYEWLEDFSLSGLGALGNGAKAPKVCFVFATTDPGKLLEPLRNRCERIDLQFYNVEEIEIILRRAAIKAGISEDKLCPDALRMMAQSSRGIPRIAIMGRLNPIMDLMIVEDRSFCVDTVEELFDILELHPLGLEANDMLYCHTLYNAMQKNGNSPISSKQLQNMTGLTDNLIENLIEPYLIKTGIIRIGTRGRSLTDHGFEALALKPLVDEGTIEAVRVNQIQNVGLEKMIKNPEVVALGTAGVMAKLGLNYQNVKDRATFKAALFEIGYEVKRKAGIVPMVTSAWQTRISLSQRSSQQFEDSCEQPAPQPQKPITRLSEIS
jgi:holliday junction DNA helicase RuvB